MVPAAINHFSPTAVEWVKMMVDGLMIHRNHQNTRGEGGRERRGEERGEERMGSRRLHRVFICCFIHFMPVRVPPYRGFPLATRCVFCISNPFPVFQTLLFGLIVNALSLSLGVGYLHVSGEDWNGAESTWGFLPRKWMLFSCLLVLLICLV